MTVLHRRIKELIERVSTLLDDVDFCSNHIEMDIEYTLHEIHGELFMAERIGQAGLEADSIVLALQDRLTELEPTIEYYEEGRRKIYDDD